MEPSSKPLGIVLAGGHSERLPHKIYLCLADGRPLMCSAIDLLLGKIDVTVCVREEHRGFVATLLHNLYPDRGNGITVHTDRFAGVVPLLGSLADATVRPMAVVCADNIYGPLTSSVPLSKPNGCYAAVNQLASKEGLDGYDTSLRKWVCRSAKVDIPLTTPWRIPTGARIAGANVPEMLNGLNAVPWLIPDPEWRDLGTVSALDHYYASLET